MSDPERLLDHGTEVEARLLGSALDEPPPPELLARTLAAVAVAAPAAAVGAGAAKVAAAASVKGGILGAVGVGALAGALVVGAFELATPRVSAPPPAVTATVAPPLPTAAQIAPTAPIAPASVSASAASPPPSARPANLVAEIALLDEARRALDAGDVAGARAALDRYAREMPRGQMAREAAVLRKQVEAARDGAKTIP